MVEDEPEEAAGCPPWLALRVGSGFEVRGCDAVEGLSSFCLLRPVLSGWPWEGGADMMEEKEGRDGRKIKCCGSVCRSEVQLHLALQR